MNYTKLAAVAVLCASASTAHAVTYSSTVADAVLTPSFFTQDVGEFNYQPGLTGITSVNVSGSFGYANGGSYLGLVNLLVEGATFFTGTSVASCLDGFFNSNCDDVTFSADLDSSLFSEFTDGLTDISASVIGGGSASFRFSDLTLTIEADALPAVPLPAGLPLAAGAFGLFGLVARRKARG